MDIKKILVLIITVLLMLVLLLFCKLLDGRAITIPTEESTLPVVTETAGIISAGELEEEETVTEAPVNETTEETEETAGATVPKETNPKPTQPSSKPSQPKPGVTPPATTPPVTPPPATNPPTTRPTSGNTGNNELPITPLG